MAVHVNKRWIVLAVALAVGALAAFGANRYIRSRVELIEARDRNRETVQVVVAKDNLAKGMKLSSANVAVRAVPKEWSHGLAILPSQFSRAEGSTLEYPAHAGEALLWSQLEGQRVATFSARLVPGRRAITLPVDEISSTSCMVAPGDFIDLVVTVTRNKDKTLFALMQGVQVLATGRQASTDVNESAPAGARGFTTITLDASPEDARRIIAAREVGKLTALLRAPGDRAPIAMQRSDPYALLGLQVDAKPATTGGTPVIYGGGGQIRLPEAVRAALVE
ncbi:Flp pilus assembly protein CpaB [soil metagenome]